MSTQCAHCNADALGFCLCDQLTSSLCASCFSDHSQDSTLTVHILLPLDLDPSIVLSHRVGDYIERNRRAKLFLQSMEKHINLLSSQLEKHVKDLERTEEELHVVVARKIEVLKETAVQVIHAEIAEIRRLMREITLEAKKIDETTMTLSGEMMAKCDSLDIFAGIQSSELRIVTTSLVQSINALQGVSLVPFLSQLTDRLSLSCLFYFQAGYKQITAFNPLRGLVTTREVTMPFTFLEGTSICHLSSDQLVLTGGTWSSNAGIINVKKREYTAITVMNTVRAYHGSVLYKNAVVYAFGGSYSGGTNTTFEMYSLKTAKWTQANLPRGMKNVTIACIKDKFYLCDYNSGQIECFSPAASSFKTLSYSFNSSSTYPVLVAEGEKLVVIKGNTVVTCEILGEDLREIGRSMCDETTWQVWQSPVFLCNSHYFFNYNGRKIYSVNFTSQGASVKTIVNYEFIKA